MENRVITAFIVFVAFCLSSDAEEKMVKPASTFIDTLNRGREFSLADSDFTRRTTPLAVTVDTSTPDTVQPVTALGQSKEAGVVPSRFKIQVMAGPNEQQIKKERNSLAGKTALPVAIVFEPPYYKLFVGDFTQHSEAETWCARIREMGYRDAWIVRTASSKNAH